MEPCPYRLMTLAVAALVAGGWRWAGVKIYLSIF
jgi:hypothetical protein